MTDLDSAMRLRVDGSEQPARITAAALEEIGHERVPLTARLGLTVTAVSYGHATVVMPFREDFLRPGGTVAGPIMMAAADFAMWGAVLSMIGPVELAVTTNLNINFLQRPAPAAISAHARVLKLGRRLAVGEIDVCTELPDERILVAHCTCTYSIPPRDDA